MAGWPEEVMPSQSNTKHYTEVPMYKFTKGTDSIGDKNIFMKTAWGKMFFFEFVLLKGNGFRFGITDGIYS